AQAHRLDRPRRVQACERRQRQREAVPGALWRRDVERQQRLGADAARGRVGPLVVLRAPVAVRVHRQEHAGGIDDRLEGAVLLVAVHAERALGGGGGGHVQLRQRGARRRRRGPGQGCFADAALASLVLVVVERRVRAVA